MVSPRSLSVAVNVVLDTLGIPTVGSFCAILAYFCNIMWDPGSLWELSVWFLILIRVFPGVPGPYRNFTYGPGAYREISTWSMVLMGTFRVVIGLSGSFVCDLGSLRELLCGPRCSWGLSVPSQFLIGTFCVVQGSY